MNIFSSRPEITNVAKQEEVNCSSFKNLTLATFKWSIGEMSDAQSISQWVVPFPTTSNLLRAQTDSKSCFDFEPPSEKHTWHEHIHYILQQISRGYTVVLSFFWILCKSFRNICIKIIGKLGSLTSFFNNQIYSAKTI